jgi:hypothetical protein
MKKKKILLSIGAIILFGAGVLADRSSKKFAATGLYVIRNSTCQKIFNCAPIGGTYTTGGNQSKLTTCNNTVALALYATSTCLDKICFF